MIGDRSRHASTPSRTSGWEPPRGWLLLACLVLWGCSTSDQVLAERRADRIRQHVAWMEGCAAGPVVFHESVDLDIYSADLSRGDPEAVMACLLAVGTAADDTRIVARGPERLAAIVATPFYTMYRAEQEEERAAPAALIRSRAIVHVLQPNADFGVGSLQHVSGDVFVVSSGYVTHVRNALFRATAGEATPLSNGKIEIADRAAPWFRVIDAKSFWNPGGAFWYDAIVDQRNRILDIVTPRTGIDVTCLSRARFVRHTHLDLSNVSAPEICVSGTPHPGVSGS